MKIDKTIENREGSYVAGRKGMRVEGRAEGRLETIKHKRRVERHTKIHLSNYSNLIGPY